MRSNSNLMRQSADDIGAESMSGTRRIEWVSSIDDIDRKAWDVCFGTTDVLCSYALQKATEKANLARVRFHYLLVRDANTIVAIFPCFEFSVSLTTVASAAINRWVTAVRKQFPRFLYLRAFVIGTPVAICRDLFGIRPDLDAPTRAQLLDRVCRAAITRAEELRIGLVVVKEIPSRLLKNVNEVLRRHFIVVESPATTYLYVGDTGTESYRARLRKKYRSVMTGRLRDFGRANLRWELHADFARHARAMHALYLQVLRRSKTQFEELSPEFFEQVNNQLGADSFALLCYHGDRLVACELFVRDRHWVHPIYLGMDYAYRDSGALYFNCIYKIIDVIECEGKSVVQLGQTSYEAKSGIGAVVARLYLGVRHRRRLLHGLLVRFQSVLFPPTPIPRQQRVFRDVDANNQALRRHQVDFVESLDDTDLDR